MNEWTHWIGPVAIGAILLFLTEYFKHVCLTRWRLESATLKDGAPQPKPFFLGLLIPPAAILILTPLALEVLSLSARLAADLAVYAKPVAAWRAFWLILFFVNGAECLLRLFFYLRNRRFPVPPLLRDILHFAIVVGVLMLVSKQVLGRDISTALASTAIVTAVVGFALQGVLGNLLAGISLHVVRAAVPGDWIAVGKEIEGEVISGNWRETRLRTLEGHYLVVPNSLLASSVLHNMSYPNRERHVELEIGASYEDAPAEVIDALVTSAKNAPGVRAEPEPIAVLSEYKDFGINYKLFYATDHYERRIFTSNVVLSRIWYEFKRRGISIPFPMGDPGMDEVVSLVHQNNHRQPNEEEIADLVDDLFHSDIVGQLLIDSEGTPLVSAQELHAVAANMKRVRYTANELLFRQGEPGDSAYVLVNGTLAGTIQDSATRQIIHQFKLQSGAFVGEMSLLTGDPRTATITSIGETELIAFSQQAFVKLLALRPDIPEKLANLVATRHEQNDAAQKAFAASTVGEPASRRASLLARFRGLLRLARR